jgi:hypothetical protein
MTKMLDERTTRITWTTEAPPITDEGFTKDDMLGVRADGSWVLVYGYKACETSDLEWFNVIGGAKVLDLVAWVKEVELPKIETGGEK